MIDPSPPDPLARYHRQMLLPGIGRAGQQMLSKARVLVLGCGALGTVAAETLARAGVGELILVDRDFVELTNLQRQVLFDEDDLAAALPKAEAARRKLSRINSQIRLSAVIDDVNHTNIESLATGCDAIIDGLDNYETRFLANDVAVKHGIAYLYGGAVGTQSMTFTILPHGAEAKPWAKFATPCLRCIFGEAPPPGGGETCDSAGVLASAVNLTASWQAAEAIKVLVGAYDALRPTLLYEDLWRHQVREMDVAGFYDSSDCPCCKGRRFEYLQGRRGGATDRLCGRNAVQVVQQAGTTIDFDIVAAKLRSHGPVRRNKFMLQASLSERDRDYDLTLFTDGRAIIKGTDQPTVARSLYAKYVGT